MVKDLVITSGRSILNGAVKLNVLVAIGSQLEKTSFSRLKIDSGTSAFLLASICGSKAPHLFQLNTKVEALAWTYFIQSALILGLWAGKPAIKKRVSKPFVNPSPLGSIRQWIPIIMVFLIGSLGSVVGGLFGFHIANMVPLIANNMISRDSLSVLSSCLTASYIGGSVNFFETAKVLGATGRD
jgi:hypothetical protein